MNAVLLGYYLLLLILWDAKGEKLGTGSVPLAAFKCRKIYLHCLDKRKLLWLITDMLHLANIKAYDHMAFNSAKRLLPDLNSC